MQFVAGSTLNFDQRGVIKKLSDKEAYADLPTRGFLSNCLGDNSFPTCVIVIMTSLRCIDIIISLIRLLTRLYRRIMLIVNRRISDLYSAEISQFEIGAL